MTALENMEVTNKTEQMSWPKCLMFGCNSGFHKSGEKSNVIFM